VTRAQVLVQRAAAAQERKELTRALTLLEQAIKLDPTAKAAYNSLGNVYYQQGRYQQALAMYQKALAIDPDYAKARTNLGSTYMQLTMDMRAIDELQKVLRADSSHSLAYYNLACVYARSGNSTMAAQYLQQAIMLEPQARTWAQTDTDFARVRTAPEVQQLLGPWHTMKRYFWLLYLLLATVAAALAAQMVNAYISAQLAAPLKPTQTQASRTAGPLTQRAPLTHYEIINKRNIFNATPPSDTPEPSRAAEPPPPPLEVPATPLPLKLVGIMAGKQAQAPRFAIIESTGNPPGQAVYQVGDSVQQVFIVDILPGCVILDRGGGQQKLCFEKDAGSAPAPGATPRAAAVAPVPPPASQPGDAGGADSVRVDTGTWQVRRE
jgi:type II secretory pathway component PulC